jgi:hypothetical protein
MAFQDIELGIIRHHMRELCQMVYGVFVAAGERNGYGRCHSRCLGSMEFNCQLFNCSLSRCKPSNRNPKWGT